MPRRSASGSSSSIRSSTSRSGRGRSLTSASGSVPVGTASSVARFGEHDSFAGHLPQHRERRFQAWVQVSMGCNSVCSYCIVPGCSWARAEPQTGRRARGDRATGSRRGAGDHVARTERQLVGSRPRPRRQDGVRRAAPRLWCGRRHRSRPLHEPSPEGLPRARDRRDGRDAPLSASRSTCRSSRARRVSSRRCDGHTTPIATWRSSDGSATRSPTWRSARTSSSGSPARPRTSFAETLAVVEAVRFDSAFTFVYSPRNGTEAAEMPDQVHPM